MTLKCRKDKRAKAVIEKEASGKIGGVKKGAFADRRKAVNDSRQRANNRVKVKPADFDLWGGL